MKTTTTLTADQASKMEAAGFNRYHTLGMTNPVIARKLGVTVDEVKAYRVEHGIPSSSYAKREWLKNSLRAESKKPNYYTLNLGKLAEKLGASETLVRTIMAESNIPKPQEQKRDFVRQLQSQGIHHRTIIGALGVSSYVIKTA